MSALILLRPHSPSTRLVSSSGQQSTTHLVVGNGSTSTWFSDTSANQQFAPDLATLTESSPYLVNDHLYVGDGNDISISNIGYTMLRSPKHTFTLSNVLRVPHITKPLLSVQKFSRDNNVYFEFHAFVFYLNDLITKVVLLFD